MTLRALVFAAVAACAALPSAGAVDPPASATMFKSTQQSVRVVFRNGGSEPIVAVRQVLPNPFVITEVHPQPRARVSCLGGRGEYACSGFVRHRPGRHGRSRFDSPPVYDDTTGLDASYYPQKWTGAVLRLDGGGGSSGRSTLFGTCPVLRAVGRGRRAGAAHVAEAATPWRSSRRAAAALDERPRRRPGASGRVRCGARLRSRALRVVGSGDLLPRRRPLLVARAARVVPAARARRVEVRLGRVIVRRAFAGLHHRRVSEERLDRRQLVVRGALGAAGMYALVDSLAARPARAALAARPKPQREQHVLKGQRMITRDGTQVVVPPLHHQVVTTNLRIAPTREALLAARRRLERALARVAARHPATPAGVGVTVAWGALHLPPVRPAARGRGDFPRLPSGRTCRRRARSVRVPPCCRPRRASRATTRGPRARGQRRRLPLPQRLAGARRRRPWAGWPALGPCSRTTSIRKGFVGGGFDGGVGLPKQMALAAGIDGAELIPVTDPSSSWVSPRRSRRALAPDRDHQLRDAAGGD